MIYIDTIHGTNGIPTWMGWCPMDGDAATEAGSLKPLVQLPPSARGQGETAETRDFFVFFLFLLKEMFEWYMMFDIYTVYIYDMICDIWSS